MAYVYSGAGAYPHAFTNYSREEKILQRDALTERKMRAFCDVAQKLNAKCVIFAGSYVHGSKLALYSEYLHQATPKQLEKYFDDKNIEGTNPYIYSGDKIDTDGISLKRSPYKEFHNFSMHAF